MNIIGLYGESGFVGTHFQSTLKKIDNNSQIYLLPHRGSPHEIKIALKNFDAINTHGNHKSILYLAENNDIASANKLGVQHIKKNIERLQFILSNTKSKIIYASSVSVYGDLTESPHHTEEILKASNPYAHSKLECENLVLQSSGIVARLSNIYGLGMSDKNIISDVIKQIKVGTIHPIKIINGTPVRDMIHISDVTSCLLAMTKTQEKGVYNVASGNNVSMKSLAIMILKAANTVEYTLVESNHDQSISCISLDISKTRSTFNWSPYINLKNGLKELI
tara:strand:+ start:1246 stop:2082 length:837 start_codon:yes stop_codon:yes gene_type:complete